MRYKYYSEEGKEYDAFGPTAEVGDIVSIAYKGGWGGFAVYLSNLPGYSRTTVYESKGHIPIGCDGLVKEEV